MSDNKKDELYHIIDDCTNESVLYETQRLLESERGMSNWWNELSYEDKYMLTESEIEYEKENFILHKELMQQFEVRKWK